jgi:hypothetical protein
MNQNRYQSVLYTRASIAFFETQSVQFVLEWKPKAQFVTMQGIAKKHSM